ncbi:MAG: phosphotransferase [Roseiflexaceae bacterium]
MHDPSPKPLASSLAAQIQSAHPELVVSSARLREGEGQFNDVLVVNETLIFRFPRGPQAAAGMAATVGLLERLRGRLPLPIPDPRYRATDPHTGALRWVGYPMLPGEPLWHETLAALADEAALDRLALQLAGFLRALHTLPPDVVAPHLAPRDEALVWAGLAADFERELFPFMRPDARNTVAAQLKELLEDLRAGPSPLALRHGDFGGGNLLYDPASLVVTGVIDFDFAGLGDPALDVAALSTYGEAFLARGLPAYPAMAAMLPRARRYRATFALQQALYALRAGDQAEFEDGIAEYV